MRSERHKAIELRNKRRELKRKRAEGKRRKKGALRYRALQEDAAHTHKIIRYHRGAVVYVCARLAVRDPEKKAAVAQPLRLIPLYPVWILFPIQRENNARLKSRKFSRGLGKKQNVE